jgi:hypothetical protein
MLHSPPAAFDQASLDDLTARMQGTVLTPHDPDYDTARLAWNRTVEQYPALIVQARSASDVSEAVRFARAHGLGIAVQSTGHGVVRPADGSLLVLTSQMTGVRVDAEAQTAWIEAGVQWGRVLEKAQAVGLAPLLGSSPHVGVMGYTLGGGIGWLARKYGLAADSVHFFELVTADGRLIRASRTENSNLFWGLRGGGGSFGIMTGMEVQLYPVTTVYGGNAIFPVEYAKEIYTLYRDWIRTAPDELTSSISLMNFPTFPQVPEFLRGKSVVVVRGCYVGPVENGERLFQVWHNGPTPIANSFRVMPFTEVATISNDPLDPTPSYNSGAWMRELNDATIDTLIKYGVSRNGSSPLVVSEVRHAGGAISKVDPQSNAFGNRDASFVLSLIGVAPTPEAREHVARYAAQFKEALAPVLTGGVYLNFLGGKEARARTRDAYSAESYRRLMALKARYDPDNLFRFGYDIPPVTDAN